MSIFRKLAVQNGVVVVREHGDDGSTRVVDKVVLPELEKHLREKVLPMSNAVSIKKATWRTALRKLTNNGEDLMVILYNLANGNAQQVRLPDGRVSEPIIPSPEVQRSAASDLFDRLHGKSVAQTEVVKAEMEAEDHAQYAALSDEQLKAALEGTKWAIAAKKREALSAGDTDQSEEGD